MANVDYVDYENPFEVGDVVICVNGKGNLIKGSRHVISSVVAEYVYIDGVSTLKYYATRFKLLSHVTPAKVLDPAKPFPYPDDDAAREARAREKLREYKKGMRDFLYGTTSD